MPPTAFSALRRGLRRAEDGIGTSRGALAVVAAAVVVYGLESIALPVIPGRDFGTYLRSYAQLWDWHSVWPMTMLFRTPLAPLVVGLPLDVAGGWAAQVVMGLLFALSVLAWSRTALAFGGRAALLATVALLLYPGYSILFHELASDAVAAVAFSGWALALSRAWHRPSARRFALVGLAVAATALSRPANQVLVVAALAPLVLAIPWPRRIACAFACAGTAVLVLGVWAVNNGLRYQDYAVSRAGDAYLPFFRAFTQDHIVAPENGPASRKLARAVQRQLLTQEPYRSYRVDLRTFFARGSDREFEDVVGLSDRVWGWDTDYAVVRKAGIEAVRAHPRSYAAGVANTFLRELWHPLFVALPGAGDAGVEGGRASVDSVVVGGRRLPSPGSEAIPAAHQSFASSTPDGHITEVWTSPTEHTVVFRDSRDQRRYASINAEVGRLTAQVPPYAGNEWLTRQLSRSSKLFPPPLLWLVAGLVGLAVRRPLRSGLALTLAFGPVLVTLVNAMTIYPVIEFAVPVAPALVVLGAAGLLGARSGSARLHRSRKDP